MNLYEPLAAFPHRVAAILSDYRHELLPWHFQQRILTAASEQMSDLFLKNKNWRTN